MFLKYDLKDPVNGHTFNGIVNLSQIIQIIRPRLWSEIWLITPNPDKTPLYKSPNEENVDKVYNALINLIKNSLNEAFLDLGELGELEIIKYANT